MSRSPDNLLHSDDGIDLRGLLLTLWRGKWLILTITLAFASLGTAYSLYKPNIYKASALLAPVQEEGGVNGIGGQLGGLASLAGINLGAGGSNKTEIAKEVLRSRAFLSDFISRYELAAPLIAAEAWDSTAQQWIYDTDRFNPETKKWTDIQGESEKPTDWDLVDEFRKKLNINENADNGMITLSVKNLSPKAARQWVDWLVRDINEYMRQQDIQEAESSVEYLEGKLKETNIAGMQQIFYQLIENETRTIMLANAKPEYVFKTVDPAVEPQEHSEPKRLLIMVLSVLVGGMFGVFAVFVVGLQKRSYNTNSLPEKNQIS